MAPTNLDVGLESKGFHKIALIAADTISSSNVAVGCLMIPSALQQFSGFPS